MKIKEKIGLLGVGNMGAAIIEGLLEKKIAKPSQIYVCDKISQKATQFAAKWKVQQVPYAASLVSLTNVILLAIKPQDLSELGHGLKINLQKKEYTIISILAGIPIEKIKNAVGKKAHVVRAMPNLGAKVGESITALTSTTPKSLKIAKKIFSGCGETVVLEEKYFDLVTAVSGSGPAYFFLLMELLSQAAQKGGLPKASADLLAIQTAAGAARLAQTSQARPAELRQMVTSKKGTTDAALQYLSKKSFGPIFIEAVHQAMKRAKQLSQLS